MKKLCNTRVVVELLLTVLSLQKGVVVGRGTNLLLCLPVQEGVAEKNVSVWKGRK